MHSVAEHEFFEPGKRRRVALSQVLLGIEGQLCVRAKETDLDCTETPRLLIEEDKVGGLVGCDLLQEGAIEIQRAISRKGDRKIENRDVAVFF